VAAWQHKLWKKRSSRRTAKLHCWRLDEGDRGRRRAAAIVAIRACEVRLGEEEELAERRMCSRGSEIQRTARQASGPSVSQSAAQLEACDGEIM